MLGIIKGRTEPYTKSHRENNTLKLISNLLIILLGKLKGPFEDIGRNWVLTTEQQNLFLRKKKF